MIEKILLYLLEKILNYFKKKYPNGDIAKYALVEIDKLDQTIQDKIAQYQVNDPSQLKQEIINEAKVKIDDVVNILKNKVTGGK